MQQTASNPMHTTFMKKGRASIENNVTGKNRYDFQHPVPPCFSWIAIYRKLMNQGARE
jgi:hypothetical protein